MNLETAIYNKIMGTIENMTLDELREFAKSDIKKQWDTNRIQLIQSLKISGLESPKPREKKPRRPYKKRMKATPKQMSDVELAQQIENAVSNEPDEEIEAQEELQPIEPEPIPELEPIETIKAVGDKLIEAVDNAEEKKREEAEEVPSEGQGKGQED